MPVQHHSSADVPEILASTIRGVEKKPLPYHLYVTNLILHGINQPILEHNNTLAQSWQDIHLEDRVDIIIINPPFGGMEEDGIKSNFRSAYHT